MSLAQLEDAVDHIRGGSGRLILEYGDYECPYTRAAYREIQKVERSSGDGVRFAFRHFPLTEIHPHALAAAAAAEAAALQSRFWEMCHLLFRHQSALESFDLRRYAEELELDPVQFDRDRASAAVMRRIDRDLDSAIATGQVRGTPTLFIDGVLHRGAYDVASLVEALAG
jgi:protein-disulfide isomerase